MTKNRFELPDPLLVLTVEQIQALVERTSGLPGDCEVALAFMVADAGIGLYAWPICDGNARAAPLVSMLPDDLPPAPAHQGMAQASNGSS